MVVQIYDKEDVRFRIVIHDLKAKKSKTISLLSSNGLQLDQLKEAIKKNLASL